MTTNHADRDTVEVTIQVPRALVEFAHACAHAHDTTVSVLVEHWLGRLRAEFTAPATATHPAVRRIAGIVRSEIDVDAAWARWREIRHR